jgi:hypothetical protein
MDQWIMQQGRKTENKTWHESLLPSYSSKLSISFGIKELQGCQTSNNDAKGFVFFFGDDSWSWSWSGVGAPRPARLGT